ncbi:tape measure protein [Corynebacterium cystitidis]|uniref:tape measure protein n=1 Tax=Corynebacterium cystitidis TaxID=35757 RepID=UPI00211DBCCE|nr:tape measure protein [Corynebacterium cystitidis]
MAELGVGYISIVPEVSKITPGIAKALGQAEPTVEKSGKSLGGRLSSGMGTALKTTALGVGATAGGAVAAGIAKGMGRLTGIENAQASLRGLGHDAQSVDRIMGDALASVKGTAFGLETAAGVAASAVAAGIRPGEDLERTLKMVGDAATIAGVDMGAMGSIVNKVATSDMMQMDVANQLMDAGIPILQMVADEMGVTADEARKMASEGKVSFETFQNALEGGVGGAALEAGNTFKGAMANVGAALGRVGATSLKPFFELSKDGMNLATKALDGLEARIGPWAAKVSDWLDGTAVPAVKNFASSMKELGQSQAVQGRLADLGLAFDSLVDAGRALLPVVVNVGTALGKAGAAIGVAAWDTFVATLTTAGDVAKTLAGPLEVVTGFLADHPGLVTAAIGAWGASKIVPDVIGKIGTAVGPAWQGLKEFGHHTSEAARLAQWMNPELSESQAMFTGLTSQVKRAGEEMGGFRGAASNVVGLFGGPWGLALMAATAGIAGVAKGHASARQASEEYAAAIANASNVNDAFANAVAGTTGALTEQQLALGADVIKNSIAGLETSVEAMQGIRLKNPFEDHMDGLNDFQEKVAEAARVAADNSNSVFTGLESQVSDNYSRLMNEVKDAYGEMETYLSEAGYSMEDLYTIVAEGGPAYGNLIAHLNGLSDGGALVAQHLVEAKNEMDATEEAARRVDPAAQQAAAGIDVLADSASSGEDKLQALESVMQAMGLAPKNAEQAMMDAAEAVDELIESAEGAERPVAELGSALFDSSGELDRNNESARDLAEKLSGMREELQNVAVNGGDTQATFEDMQGAVGALAQEFGLTEDEVRGLYEAYGILPEEIDMLVNLNSEGVSADLATIWSELYPLEEGATIEVGAVADEALEVLDALGIEYERTPDGKNLVITAASDEAMSELQEVTSKLSEVGDMDVSPTVFLDKTPLELSASEAQSLIDTLDIQNPSPQAQLIIDNLLSNGQIAQGDLNLLGAMSPTPAADLNKKLLDAGVQGAHIQLDEFAKRKTATELDAKIQNAISKINEVHKALSAIPLRRKVEIVTNTITNRIRGRNEADGSVRRAADGWLSDQEAQIAPGGSWVTWAEDETQGESFIPHALSKRKRSTQILAETARIFGLGVVDRGGNEVKRDGTSVAPKSNAYMADGGVRSADDLLAFARGESVGGYKASRSLQGAPYVFGGHNWGDCSSTQGMFAQFAKGENPIAGGRYMATMNQQTQLDRLGFKSGLGTGARFAVGWFNGGPWGGHTSGTIHFDDGKAVNVEMGGGAGGQGKIGGAAAGAAHSQYTHRAHLPLPPSGELGYTDEYGEALQFGTGGGISEGIASTSVDGYRLKSGKTVSWGKASDLFEQAKDYTRRGNYWRSVNFNDVASRLIDTMNRSADAFSKQKWELPLRDRGGRFPNDYAVANRSGADELVLTNAQWRMNTEIAKALPAAGIEIQKAGHVLQGAADTFADAVDDADRQVLSLGRGFGGSFIGSAEIVRDAEQGLVDTRLNIATQAENISEAEKELAEAREELAKVEAEGGGLTTAQKRKQADAERALSEARSKGLTKSYTAEKKAKDIAKAEEKLARVREDNAEALEKSEDKNAKNVQKAQEKVYKAEDKVMDARYEHADALSELEAAERTVIAARFQAASDLATGVAEAWSQGFEHISSLFGEMARLAGIVDDTRQSVSKLQMQQQTANLERIKALGDLRIKTQDLDRVRAEGVISVAEAEWNLEQARDRAKIAGLSSIEAMEGAMDRFYRTGVFSIGELTDAQVEQSEEVQAALWGVRVAHARNAKDQLDAARQQEIAQYKVAAAMLEQAKVGQLLSVQTELLKHQTAELNGMTQNQATGAARGFGGIGKIGSGIGKIGGAILAGLAGFAVGGPVGALAAVPLAIGGLKDAIEGGIDVHHNRDEIGKAWSEMGALGKVSIVGGSLLGGAAGIAGGYLGGAEGAVIGSEIGSQLIGATVGNYQYSIASKIESLQRRSDDRMSEIERDFERQAHELDLKALGSEIDYLREADRLESGLKYAELMRDAVTAPTEKLRKAYEDAAKQEEQRANRHHDQSMDAIDAIEGLSRRQADAVVQLPGLLRQVLGAMSGQRSAASGVGYLQTHI